MESAATASQDDRARRRVLVWMGSSMVLFLPSRGLPEHLLIPCAFSPETRGARRGASAGPRLPGGPCAQLAGNDLAVASRDGFPVNPGHAHLLSRRHFERLFELTAEEQAPPHRSP
jgi:hypothetical protein